MLLTSRLVASSGCFMKCAAFFTIAGIGFCFSAIVLLPPKSLGCTAVSRNHRAHASCAARLSPDGDGFFCKSVIQCPLGLATRTENIAASCLVSMPSRFAVGRIAAELCGALACASTWPLWPGGLRHVQSLRA